MNHIKIICGEIIIHVAYEADDNEHHSHPRLLENIKTMVQGILDLKTKELGEERSD